MKEVRYFYVPEAVKLTVLPDEEAQHAVRVLRMKEGDPMVLMDGNGVFYEAVVTLTSAKRCAYEIVSTLPQQPAWRGKIHLAIAPTKLMDRIEWMAEKATEIGFDRLTFLNCRFSERTVLKVPRIEKIVVAAMKQSRKAWKPEVVPFTTFSDFIAHHQSGHRFICHCYNEVERTALTDELERVPADAEVTVLIGPEGDFSIDEVKQAVDNGFISVHLGSSRLRTETAGLVAVMMMQMAKQISENDEK